MVVYVFKFQINSTVVALHIHDLLVGCLLQDLELGVARASLVEHHAVCVLIQLAYVCKDVGLDSQVVVSTSIEAIVAEDSQGFALRYRDAIQVHHLVMQFWLLWLCQRANWPLVRNRIYFEL